MLKRSIFCFFNLELLLVSSMSSSNGFGFFLTLRITISEMSGLVNGGDCYTWLESDLHKVLNACRNNLNKVSQQRFPTTTKVKGDIKSANALKECWFSNNSNDFCSFLADGALKSLEIAAQEIGRNEVIEEARKPLQKLKSVKNRELP